MKEKDTMKPLGWLMTMGICLLTGPQSMGQSPVIMSFQENGRVTWTNALNTNAIYRMEWASQVDGPWHSFTYQPIHTLDAHGSTSFEAEVPMFYRVIMTTNQPPRGMVWIDGGDVELGQEGVATPVHTNYISGFWMDEMEVTKAKWDEVYNWAITNAYAFVLAGEGKAFNHPVVNVIWYDCVKWCNARSQKEGLRPCYYTSATFDSLYITGKVDLSNDWVDWGANGYRLPTEAEWEKAARGGRQGQAFPWGGATISHQQANYYSSESDECDASPTHGWHPAYTNGGAPYTSPAGSFAANGYGLHDMAGNVIEWCFDWHPGNEGSARTFRGGGWNSYAANCQVGSRSSAEPGYAFDSVGFRTVRAQGQ